LIEADGHSLLIDCGSGVLGALARTETGYEELDMILLTHHHLDHISDLDVLMKARWLAGATDLTIAGPSGTAQLIEDLLGVHEYMQNRLDLTCIDLEETTFTFAGFDIIRHETRHSMPCSAYRLTPTGGGPSVTISGDTEPFEELIEFADGSEVLIHDCSFPDDVDVSNHPTPARLGAVLDTAATDIGRVYLTHLYPHTEGRHEEMLTSVEERYDGDVRFAKDGHTIIVD
jgi:ribonuclease BN (tRNA processing enzyme)